jgi:hypothetical protein
VLRGEQHDVEVTPHRSVLKAVVEHHHACASVPCEDDGRPPVTIGEDRHLRMPSPVQEQLVRAVPADDDSRAGSPLREPLDHPRRHRGLACPSDRQIPDRHDSYALDPRRGTPVMPAVADQR